MSAMASQITSLTIVYSTIYSGADQRKHQICASLAFVWEIHRWPANYPHKGPVTRIMFPFDDIIMDTIICHEYQQNSQKPLYLARYINASAIIHILDILLFSTDGILNISICSLVTAAFLCWLQWRHNERNGVSNHQPYDSLLNYLFRRRSKKTSNLRVPGLCVGNPPMTGELPAQRASNAENVSIWWHHYGHHYLSWIPAK